MSEKEIIKRSPLKGGLSFSLIIFAFILIRDYFKYEGLNSTIILAASIGAVVGGFVYGLIIWLRYRNK